ncbi:hypothetical protein P280DRAFT_258210 [Massarina eburnea CBS 473.64]|uniref:HTH TFE/IIEalpha-type domain-containing protein n=1 Tax=Massarina eburnea CBS 473.64 TaxID=1395130 RepID=A0A6A6RH71_9PLEO|nr:hypothetical protein P280DRAFT_258210 [Massarina eburnea CBS 473.64]
MDPLQLGKTFVKTVVRMFYETEHIVVIDALVYHGALSLTDLVLVLDAGKNTKGVGKICGKLKEGGLISVYSRQETREGAMKSINREYYYIDYRHAIDAVKYKIHKIDERIKKDAKPTTEKMEYACKRCKSQWTTMDVVDLIDDLGRDSGFLCKQCEYPLTEITNDDDQAVDSDDTPAKFNKLFDPIVKLMQQIDQMSIPAVEGKDALDAAIELPRDKELNPGARHEAVEESVTKPTAVKGTNNVVEQIQIEIASTSEYNEAARAAEKARQEKVALQNALPEWHTKSTVAPTKGNDGNAQAGTTAANGVKTPSIKTETVDTKANNQQSMDDVFAQIEAEQKRKEQEQEEDEEDDDEDDDEFEDVAVGTPSLLPDAKRPKLDSSAAPTPTNAATPAISTGDGGDESDEDEFVDV